MRHINADNDTLYRVKVTTVWRVTEWRPEEYATVTYQGPYTTLAAANNQASRYTKSGGWHSYDATAVVEYATVEWEERIPDE